MLSYEQTTLITLQKIEQKSRYNARTLPLKTYFILTSLQNNSSAVFEATTNLPFLCYKSAITCQTDSYKVSKSKLKPDLFNCVQTEMTESTALPQQSHKRGRIFLGTPCIFTRLSRATSIEIDRNIRISLSKLQLMSRCSA